MGVTHSPNRLHRAPPRARFVLLTLVAAALSACRAQVAHTSDPAEARLLRASPGKPMLRTELSFGLKRRDGGVVSDDEWRAFLRDEVTPRFPGGLTVLDSRGQWRGPDQKLVEEPSRVVIFLYDPTDPSAGRHIEEIRGIYKSRFDQDSVMRADSVERLSF
jgi:hypothetical protein